MPAECTAVHPAKFAALDAPFVAALVKAQQATDHPAERRPFHAAFGASEPSAEQPAVDAAFGATQHTTECTAE